MFSTLDLASAKNDYYSRSSDSHYSPNKSEVSYELSAMAAKDRGEIIEVMIADYLNDCGVDASIHPHKAYDIDMYHGGRHVKIEVKSAMKAKKLNQYKFQNIKPELFDLLIIAFVDPDCGLQVKTVSKREVEQFQEAYVRGDKGYVMTFDENHNGPVLTTDIDMVYNKSTVTKVTV